MRHRQPRPRPGFALATALLTLGLIGALVTGTFFLGTHEQRTGTDVLSATRALAVAELGLDAAMTTWDREWNLLMERGDRRTAPPTGADAASAVTEIVRLDNQLFLVSSEGRSGPARRIVRRYVSLAVAEPVLSAAATLGGRVMIDGASEIDGTDRAPEGWTCPDPESPVAGIISRDTAHITTDGCSLGTCVNGSPPILSDSALRHSTAGAGDLDWSALIVRATATVQGTMSPRPSERDGVCDVADQYNWGDPQRFGDESCPNHFALVHAPADLTIDGGRGQGILLVDGDLTMQGGFDFAGMVMVRGALRAGAGGARITGALTVAAAESSTPSTLRDLVVHFSRCAVHAAMLGSATPAPLTEWSWFEAVEGQ